MDAEDQRSLFAAFALHALLMLEPPKVGHSTPEHYADNARLMADAMQKNLKEHPREN